MTKLIFTRLSRIGKNTVNNVVRQSYLFREDQKEGYGRFCKRYFALEVLKVPRLGDSITEGTLSAWKKKKGEYVKADDIIATIDTDKVSIDINCKTSGVISNVFANPGDVVLVDADLCEIDTEGKPQEGEEGQQQLQQQQQQQQQYQTKETVEDVEVKGEDEMKYKRQIENAGKKKEEEPKMKEKKNETKQITGFPPMKEMSFSERTEYRVKMLPIRKRIAERLKESQNTCALLTTFNECDMSKAMVLRSELKDIFQKKYNCKLSFVSLFLYASTLALKQMPNVNAFIDDNEIVYKNYIDISVAVATSSGLTVPVIRNCQNKKLYELEKSLSEVADKARNNKLTLEDFTGGTFTISNGGVFGSMLSTPIVNMPQSAILGMHTIKNRPVVINNEIVIRPIMYLALTYDHRLLDGRDAVQFLCLIKDYIENPNLMLIG